MELRMLSWLLFRWQTSLIVFLQLRISGMKQLFTLKSKVIKNDRFYFLFQQDNEDKIKNHDY